MDSAPAARRLQDLAGLATPMALRVAATLSLVERAGPTGASAADLAAETGTVAPALRRLLDHLVTIEVFERDPDGGRYRPTSLGDQLHGDAPHGLKLLLDINAAGGRAELAFVDLLDTVTTGARAYPARYGREFWADLDARPELRRSFDVQMNRRFRVQAEQIATRFDWSRFTEILDVGGGDGTVLAAILHVHPQVRGRVLELAPTAAAAAERFTVLGLDERGTVLPGSFFDPLPVGADACLLSDIVHDWDDAHARRILTGCAQAVGPRGAVLVIEPVLGRGVDTTMDLFMLMCFGGQERTVNELAGLAADAGLMLRGSMPVADGRTLLEFGVSADGV